MSSKDKVERGVLGPKLPWEPKDTWNTSNNIPGVNILCKYKNQNIGKVENDQNCYPNDEIYKDLKGKNEERWNHNFRRKDNSDNHKHDSKCKNPAN